MLLGSFKNADVTCLKLFYYNKYSERPWKTKKQIFKWTCS